MKKLGVSVIVPMYNAAATIHRCLESIVEQKYPLREIIVIDNRSSDHSVALVEKFRKNIKRLPIRILVQRENKGLLPSYIRGATEAKSPLIIMMHSDSVLPTREELGRLVAAMGSSSVVASCPKICHPEDIWRTYNFWQKFLFAPMVGREPHGLNGKFDCYRKEAFLSVGQVVERRFVNTDEAGGEDWDLHSMLKHKGKVAYSSARVVHLHYFSGPFRLSSLIEKRRHLAKSYGKLLRIYGAGLGWKGLLAFLFKPVLATVSLVPGMQLGTLPILFVYAIFYTKKMFTSAQTLFDPRILLVPLLNIFLVFFESYWTLWSYLHTER